MSEGSRIFIVYAVLMVIMITLIALMPEAEPEYCKNCSTDSWNFDFRCLSPHGVFCSKECRSEYGKGEK